MMIAARNAMLMGGAGPWTNPYITDGLVAMWDGEWNAGGGVHDADATTWKDLVGDYDFTLTPAATIASDHISCDGTQAAGSAGAKIDLTVTQIEAVFRYLSSSANVAMFMTGGTGGPTDSYYREEFGVTFGNAYFNVANIRLTEKKTNLNAYSFDVASSTWYNGGTSAGVQSVVATFDASAARGYIGRVGGDGSKGCACELYTIRLYSRALTAAEVAANYAVDAARFNL